MASPQSKTSEGQKGAHLESVLLVYWESTCSANKRDVISTHWADSLPKFQTIWVDCLGVVGTKGNDAFHVEGITPQALMPNMNAFEKLVFLRALERKLALQTGWDISGVTREVVDWLGEEVLE
tara:strand:- start:1367 stop:1735 length:369 start_codon:yes stop_codon:yes gene_type:complete